MTKLNWFKCLVIGIAFMIPVPASAHSVTLTFTKSISDTGTGRGYRVYRLSGQCPATISLSAFTPINSVLFTNNTYTDTTAIPGSYCYVITFTDSKSVESVPSNSVQVKVLPDAPNINLGPIN
jgi:hypothetical protein